MRIIAGEYKAKRLNSPKTDKTRPTLDRVKEALFSIIDGYIRGASVLDLFSGTGNLAIESLSRGANFAWLNDDKNLAISTIVSNIQLTKYQNYVKITKKDYMKCLSQIIKEDKSFDIIFLDPPYESEFGIKSLKFISDNKGKILNEDGIIIYETDKNFTKLTRGGEDVFYNFENLECVDVRTYSNVVLYLYKWR